MFNYIDFDFFFNDTATTEIYTLSLHDALPISERPRPRVPYRLSRRGGLDDDRQSRDHSWPPWCKEVANCAERSEEHTSELQSQSNLVCRLLLEKKKNKHRPIKSNPQRVFATHT